MIDTLPVAVQHTHSHLAIPVPSGSGSRRPLPLRAIRSTGSLRTPQSSVDPATVAAEKSLSQSPPDLSYSHSSAHTSRDPDYSGTSSTGKLDSWRSAYSQNHQPEDGETTPVPISSKKAGKQRVRLDSVFGTQLPGFPYLNSAAVATADHNLRTRASRTWSDRSASASGSYAGRSSRTRSDTLGNHSSTSGTSYGAPVRTTAAERRTEARPGGDGAEVDTSCSGGSNSSDEVDLDLSFDMDLLRAKQLAERQKAAQKAVSQQSARMTGHVGIDMQEGYVADGEAGSSHLPGRATLQTSEEYRRYRLAGKKHMSRSAVELGANVGGPGATAWVRQPGLGSDSNAAIGTQHTDEPIGWSFAMTPPLSPAEIVTFAELNSQSSRFLSSLRNEASLASAGGPGKERRRSFGASELLKKRRPSFPLMSLFDRALHRPAATDVGAGAPAGAGQQSSPPVRDEDLTISTFCNADASPTPTQEYNIRYHGHFAPSSESLPPVPIMPAAYAESAAMRSSTGSPASAAALSPSMLSSPETMTADYTPETSAWNSPRSQDDELPTPKTGDFAAHQDATRFSAYSMAPVPVREAVAGIKDGLQEQVKQQGRESESFKPGHARRSSSIFRFPFVTNLFNNAFRPASPATIAPIPENETPPPVGLTPLSGSLQQSTSSSSSAAERAVSPVSADSHAGSSSEGSHAQSSDPPSPPRDGAKPSRLSGVIDGSMLRPGPNTGKGRLAGLGLSLGASISMGSMIAAAQRQSSLPVLAFTTASSDGHGSSSSESHGSASSSQQMARVTVSPLQLTDEPQYARSRSSVDSPRIAIFGSEGQRLHAGRRAAAAAAPLSAPATTIRFHDAAPDLASRLDLHDTAPTSASPRMQHHSITPAARRPRRVLPRASELDLRGRLDRMQPAQALFVAAFVLGPWCFVLGGWGLRHADGEHASVKGTQCRCPAEDDSCTCQAETYRLMRLAGGKKQEQQRLKMDRFVMLNRIGALVTGSGSVVLAITALIALGRAW